MSDIAWFGTGMMGAGLVEALRARGRDVVVSNRTFEKAKALERFGARAIADPREAARGAKRIHIMLSDDAAVDALLETIAGDIDANAVVIDHSTVAPHPTAERFAAMARRERAFLHAPVFMSPAAARTGGGVMMVAGPSATFEHVRTELESMASHLWFVGERTDKAATLKLVGNQLMFFITAGLGDAYATAASAGLSPLETYALFEHFNPGVAITGRGKTIAEADFTPHFELTMARKDARLMLETAAAGGSVLHVLPTIAARMDALIAAGHGGEDMAVLGIDAVAGATR